MCCEAHGAELNKKAGDVYDKCSFCGATVVLHKDGSFEAVDICGYSSTQCEECGSAPCDQSC